MSHDKDHQINSVSDHLPGTNGTLLGTEAGAIAEKAYGTAATANGIVQRDANGQVTIPDTPTAGTHATSKNYVDSIASGTRAPVKVLKMVSDAAQGGAPPVGPHAAGDAYVVNTWGVGYTDGDIIEWDGAAWVVIQANVGGFPPDGVRVVVSKTPAPAGSFAGQANAIATYDAGTPVWNFQAPADGWMVVVAGDGGYYEGQIFIYDSNLDVWTSSGTLVPHNNLAGLQGGTPGQYYHFTQAQHTELVRYKADVAGAGAKPAVADFAAWAVGDRGIFIGTTSRVYWVYKDGAASIQSVELK
jgi:hypothetical protein